MGGKFRFWVFFLLAFSNFTFASPLRELFEEHYTKHYQPRKCGTNVLSFMKAVDAELAGSGNFYVVTIRNLGFSVFGLVNAEKARGERFKKPAVVETNWYHHVVALDDSGLVYDFDFGVKPRIIPAVDYLEEMFLEEPECTTPKSGEFCAGRDKKLDGYEFSSVPAEALLSESGTTPVKFSMREVLQDWQILTE